MLKSIRFRSIVMFGIALLSLLSVGCKDLTPVKDESINNIDIHYQEILLQKLEYKTLFIENVAEEYKKLINNANDEEEITSYEKEAIKQMDLLILTDSEIKSIKEAYIEDFKKNKIGEISIDDVNIKYYLGKYAGTHITVIEGDYAITLYGNYTVYIITDKITFFEFDFLPEPISVFYNNQYYFLGLKDIYNLYSLEDMKNIYNKYELMLADK